ncbi:two-component system chemotaxis response regulator CheY [Rhizomicrobium palustre]|uniref:Two-component system chemotaxis response regulator CheY n=1 Tax=Rhizomicrobium palustre TaxID=189966 RepID=A0A846N3F1_9PROT|nr:two-component system chemotaxis response regulator CheY [Rhizomicrobium palustre]
MISVLAVDDSASIRQAVKIALHPDCEVTGATDGADALALARERQFDLVITDLNMPVMDGLTMIRELRKLPAYAGIPILFLTTEDSGEVKQQAKAAGATGWLTKPFAADQLSRVVKKVLAR